MLLSFSVPATFRKSATSSFHVRLHHMSTLTMSQSPVHPARIRDLNRKPNNEAGNSVVYWMTNSMRTKHNPALEHAVHLANKSAKPLHVVHIFPSTANDGQPLPERHAAFHFQGLQPVHDALQARNIPFTVFAPVQETTNVLRTISNESVLVVTDTSYLTDGIKMRKDVAKILPVPLIAVEADIVVPVETASNKSEYAARTIRPKITRLIPEYVQSLEEVLLRNIEPPQQSLSRVSTWLESLDGKAHQLEYKDIDTALANMNNLDRGAPRVHSFIGGQDAAQEALTRFLQDRLPTYGKDRNEPAKQMQSDLSPYMRAGHISPVDIVLQTNERRGGGTVFKESKESFLEELIIRRELAINMCWFNVGKYDVYKSIVPAFAQTSLELHKSDKRPKIYTYEELEAGVTHDIYWNAAQHEMILRGKQHGYMRMYWVKQIIGWVADPEEAMDIAIRLNNRWELDAVDPNSYAGVTWCFGVHDRGWTERPIWGKVRYMNEAGLKRKFNMADYVSQVENMIKKHGLPQEIAAMRKKYKKDATQTTITDRLKRTRSKSSKPSKRIKLK